MATSFATTTSASVATDDCQLERRTDSTLPSLQLITCPVDELNQETLSFETSVATLKTCVLDGLCRFALCALHFGYLTVLAFYTLRTWLTDLLTTFIRHVYVASYYEYHTTDNERLRRLIQEDKLRLTKIPKHLSILISRELAAERSEREWNTLVHELCLFSAWAWEVGVQELTVFDATGELKSMSVDVCKRQSLYLHQWINASSPSEKGRSALKFSILSPQSGRSDLARVTRDIVKAKVPSDTINIALVDQWIHENGMSDPDLLIVYDGLPHNYISLDGFPPWHIRLTEFLNENACHHLDYTVFSRALYRFSKVEQRFGRTITIAFTLAMVIVGHLPVEAASTQFDPNTV